MLDIWVFNLDGDNILQSSCTQSQYSQHFPNPKLNPIKINEIDTPAVNLDKFLSYAFESRGQIIQLCNIT